MEDKKKILVVEDDRDVRIAVRVLLEESGYRVIEAYNGKDGEKEILLNSPDMVILDLGLPEAR